jgi:hypothetical protein
MPKYNHVIEKYYYEMDYPDCLESCPIKKDVMVGSAVCKECCHCIEEGNDWIKCQYLEE